MFFPHIPIFIKLIKASTSGNFTRNLKVFIKTTDEEYLYIVLTIMRQSYTRMRFLFHYIYVSQRQKLRLLDDKRGKSTLNVSLFIHVINTTPMRDRGHA